MNIIEARERVRFHINRTQSPRMDDRRFNQAIQIATSDFILDRVDNIKRLRKAYGFETATRVREELQSLTKRVSLNLPVVNIINLPTDYMYEVGLEVDKGNGFYVNSAPVSISELLGSYSNVHYRPTSENPCHVQHGLTIEISTGGMNKIKDVILWYIKQWSHPFINDNLIQPGNNLTVGEEYYSESIVNHNGLTYPAGVVFTATSTLLTSGTVKNVKNLPLPDIAHEEICKRAAAIYAGTVENFQRNQLKESEIEKQ